MSEENARTKQLADHVETKHQEKVENQAEGIIEREYARVERARVAYERLKAHYDRLMQMSPEEIVEKRGSATNPCVEVQIGDAHQCAMYFAGQFDVSKVRGGR